jgi:beta-glucosidase
VGYRAQGRSYRFTTAPLLFPFGHGLSYTTFDYSDAAFSPAPAGAPRSTRHVVTVRVRNSGARPGREVIQVYASHAPSQGRAGAPVRTLCAYTKTALLLPGRSQLVKVQLSERAFSLAQASGALAAAPGAWRLAVGPLQLDVVCSARGNGTQGCAVAQPAAREPPRR